MRIPKIKDDEAFVRVTVSSHEVMKMVKKSLNDSNLKFEDMFGGGDEATIFLTVKKRDKSPLEQGHHILDLCSAIPYSSKIETIYEEN